MRYISGFVITFIFIMVGLPLLGVIIELFLPGSGIKELFLFIPRMVWMLFKQFELENSLNTFGLFIVIALILNGFGIYISKRKENYIYEVIALILSIIGLVTGSII